MNLNRDLSRRNLLGGAAAFGAGAALASLPRLSRGANQATPEASPAASPAATGPHTLPPLPYDYAALEPHIDTLTMQIHHDRHHATYVTNLNTAVSTLPDLHSLSPEDLIRDLTQVPEDQRTAVRNNGGGHVNHTMFWEIMKPGGGGPPIGAVAQAIDAAFGGLPGMQQQVNQAGLTRFGSGWTWVVVGADGQLAVMSTPNQDTPLMAGTVEPAGTPILGIDVWEHAYYLKYQNKRADYLTAWWNTINWDAVNQRYERARSGQ